MDAPLAVIGGGNMGLAIVRGAARGGIGVLVAEPRVERHAELSEAGARVYPSAAAALRALVAAEPAPGSGQVLLAVKPQMFADVAAELRPIADAPRVVLSIMAGLTTQRIGAALGPAVRVVRLMPNTPAMIGRGVTAWCAGSTARAGDEGLALRLFSAMGDVLPLEEDLMDAFTAVGGSGPAYVFYLAEALERGAREVGLSEVDARRIVRGVIAGAGALLESSPQDAPTLRAAVTSKGGTTQAACEAMDAAGVADAVARAVRAARDRGRALAGEGPRSA
jgi:pyrroline-5-carboxylate reductase